MSITTRDDRAAVVRAIAAILFFAVLALILGLIWIVRSPLPRLDGKIAVTGISAPVYIRRDDRGTPHIEAANENDAFYAEGFACAQDRLWQMDVLRRQAEGRISEIAGPGGITTDRYMRILGLAAAAEADARALDPASRAALEAYAAGVNAAAASHRLPLEFRLVGYGWTPWRPADTIAIAKLMAQRLDDQWYYIDVKAQLEKKVGSSAADALTDTQIRQLEVHIPGYDATARPAAVRLPGHHKSPSVARALQTVQLEALLRELPDWPRHEAGTGSNNFMVSGARTNTGKPVLSNDTHLAHTLPSTWWMADLHGGSLHVAGFTIPGLGGIILGHNERIAFGVTSAEESVQDLFIERFRSASADEYLVDGAWRKAEHRIERMHVKGEPDVVLDVLVTRHGPIIRRNGAQALALGWPILRSGGETRSLLGINRAANYAQFRTALAGFVGPVLNFGYADVDGHIGYQDAGAVPLRAAGDGSLPVEGWDERYAWRGYVPYDALPHAFDPRSGFLVTANNELVAPAYRPQLSSYFEPPFRAHRIATLIASLHGASPQAVGAIQADTFDYLRYHLAQATARSLARTSDATLHAVADMLRGWDGMDSVDARAPTFVMMEQEILVRDMLEPRLGAGLMAEYSKHYAALIPLLRALDGDQRLRSIGVTRASVEAALPHAAAEAAAALNIAGSRDVARVETWGKHNAGIYRHPLSSKWVLGFLSVPPVEQPGNGNVVYAARPDKGPSMRLVVDLANLDDSSMLLTLGESGQYSDPHYDDQLRDFAAVRWVPAPFSSGALLAATQHTLVLEPR